jgi:hypothetical protein
LIACVVGRFRVLSVLFTGALCAAGVWLAAPAAASAAVRYASPTGVASPGCVAASPCDIVTAVNDAASGDTVIIEDGTYGSPSTLDTTLSDNGNRLTIEGASTGLNRPVIIDDAGIELSGTGTSLSDIDLQVEPGGGNGIEVYGSVSVTRVMSQADAEAGDACDVSDAATITDSVCWEATSGSGSALAVEPGGTATTVVLRNDTIVGANDGLYNAGQTVTAVDCILQGGGSSKADVYNAGVVNTTLTDDEYTYVVGTFGTGGSTGQVSASPTFVDPSNGDFHEQPASASLGKGLDDSANGTYDFDGNLREIAGDTDIGAYEYVSAMPTAMTGAATGIGLSGATMSGMFNAGGAAASYQFDYGTTPALGSSTTRVSMLGTSGPEAASARLTGLAPGGTFYYHLEVATAVGTVFGSEESFKTYAATPPSIMISAPSSDTVYTRGQVVDADYVCTDNSGGSGIVSCAGSAASGQAIDTSMDGLHSFTVTAIDGVGVRAAETVRYTVESVPRLSGLRVTPRRFTALRRGGPVTSDRHAGASVRYRDSLSALTTFRVYREDLRHGHSCLIASVSTLAQRATSCVRLVQVGSFKHTDHAGAVELRFSGRVGGRTLSVGSYVLKATAVLAGEKSGTVSALFTILS